MRVKLVISDDKSAYQFDIDNDSNLVIRTRLLTYIDAVLGHEQRYRIQISELNTAYSWVSDDGSLHTGYKIAAIKALRTVLGCDLRTGKMLVEVLESKAQEFLILDRTFNKEQLDKAIPVLSTLFRVNVIEV